jgi:diphosphomevalonate decarboxylase
MKTARATAHSNIALVKYWGKREGDDPDLNLPAVGSLSMTLDELRSVTTVSEAERDAFELDGQRIDDEVGRKVFRHLDRVWAASGHDGTRPACAVTSTNHLPTAAGLASSASGFAALTMAAAGAFGDVPPSRDGWGALSQLARRGSGSAARSLWGGFVRLDRGQRSDGADCIARPLFPRDHWDLRLLVVHTARGSKAIGSTGGMERCRETSPYYPAWVDTSEADLDEAERALGSRDLPRLGRVMEHSCFKMHACMLATQPPLMYWRGTTLDVIREVWAARSDGTEGYVTSDAGPHVKVLCEAVTADTLAERLGAVQGVHEVQSVAPGPDATVEIEP